MGPVNPLALEEFEALQERHEFLQGQLDDVKAGRRELHKVIRAIDEEIVRVFAAAFADVSENFEQLFETLFPGGRGRLRLTDPDDLLSSGVEVEAKPSGKNVKKLSLLSGGERSLTALAYLFAVFRSRPSPFYVMDEVEAALDDVNLHRFLDLVGRVPPGGPAHRRQPPEAHDGGGRPALRRDHAAGRRRRRSSARRSAPAPERGCNGAAAQGHAGAPCAGTSRPSGASSPWPRPRRSRRRPASTCARSSGVQKTSDKTEEAFERAVHIITHATTDLHRRAARPASQPPPTLPPLRRRAAAAATASWGSTRLAPGRTYSRRHGAAHAVGAMSSLRQGTTCRGRFRRAVVPDVVGSPVSEAASALARAGFRVAHPHRGGRPAAPGGHGGRPVGGARASGGAAAAG